MISSPRKLNKQPLNVLMFGGHTPYEILLCETGHNFYGVPGQNVLPWNDKHGLKPLNYTTASPDVLNWVDFDCAISHNPLAHMNSLIPLFQRMPVICLFHTMCPAAFNKEMWNRYPLNLTTNVFITEHSMIDWGCKNGVVIEHTVDERFVPLKKNSSITTVVNDFVGRAHEYGLDLYQYIRQNYNGNFELYGDSPGLSQGLDRDKLAKTLGESGIYLSTALSSPISMTVLEAAKAGCAIVSTSVCALPDFFKHGESAFLFSPQFPEDCIRFLRMLEDSELRNRMGMAAKQVADSLTTEKFVSGWNSVFYGESKCVL